MDFPDILPEWGAAPHRPVLDADILAAYAEFAPLAVELFNRNHEHSPMLLLLRFEDEPGVVKDMYPMGVAALFEYPRMKALVPHFLRRILGESNGPATSPVGLVVQINEAWLRVSIERDGKLVRDPQSERESALLIVMHTRNGSWPAFLRCRGPEGEQTVEMGPLDMTAPFSGLMILHDENRGTMQ